MGKIKTVDEVTTPPRDFEFLRKLLSNIGLLRWVKKHSAENIQEDLKMCEKLEITTRDDSIAIMDSANIKMLVTNAIYTGKKHTIINLEQLDEVIKDIGNKGRLIVTDKETHPVFIETEKDTNLVVVSPMASD